MKAKFSFFSINVAAVLAAIILITGCKKEPRANFSYVITNGGIVEFTNLTAGVIDSYEWDFGDTNTSTETNPVHRYLEAGKYQVVLEVKNSDGSSSHTEVINIIEGSRENLTDHPQFGDADAYCYARNVIEYEKNTPTIRSNIKGSAIGAFYDSTNFLVSVGRVSVNGTLLTNNSDNSYSIHSDDSSNYFVDEVRWTADGGNGYPPIVESVPKSFPDLKGIVNDTFTIGVDTTYLMRTAGQILFADSVIWSIETTTGAIIAKKSTPGGVSGVFFDVDDMEGLRSPGNYVTKVVAYSAVRKTHDFKVVYYTKESFTQADFYATR